MVAFAICNYLLGFHRLLFVENGKLRLRSGFQNPFWHFWNFSNSDQIWDFGLLILCRLTCETQVTTKSFQTKPFLGNWEPNFRFHFSTVRVPTLWKTTVLRFCWCWDFISVEVWNLGVYKFLNFVNFERLKILKFETVGLWTHFWFWGNGKARNLWRSV